MTDTKGVLYKCEQCKRPLIERLPNGIWRFKFGKKKIFKSDNGESQKWNPVLMYVFGSVKIRCFRKDCGYWNVFNFFPSVEKAETPGNFNNNSRR